MCQAVPPGYNPTGRGAGNTYGATSNAADPTARGDMNYPGGGANVGGANVGSSSAGPAQTGAAYDPTGRGSTNYPGGNPVTSGGGTAGQSLYDWDRPGGMTRLPDSSAPTNLSFEQQGVAPPQPYTPPYTPAYTPPGKTTPPVDPSPGMQFPSEPIYGASPTSPGEVPHNGGNMYDPKNPLMNPQGPPLGQPTTSPVSPLTPDPVPVPRLGAGSPLADTPTTSPVTPTYTAPKPAAPGLPPGYGSDARSAVANAMMRRFRPSGWF